MKSDVEVGPARNAQARDQARASTYFWAIQRAQTSKTPVYTYFWNHALPGPDAPTYGAFHTSEVSYALATLYNSDRPFTDSAAHHPIPPFHHRPFARGRTSVLDLQRDRLRNELVNPTSKQSRRLAVARKGRTDNLGRPFFMVVAMPNGGSPLEAAPSPLRTPSSGLAEWIVRLSSPPLCLPERACPELK